MAERCIVERGHQHGVVCFISNYSWLDGLSFPLMRQHYLEEFDEVWIDCLNGDKYRTGKLTPDGRPDPSVFSTEQNREGIQVGTAITLLVRKVAHKSPAEVRFRDWWGVTKRADLVKSAASFSPREYTRLNPVRPLGLAFRPLGTDAGYLTWPLLVEVFSQAFPGVQSKQDNLVVDIDRDRLTNRMTDFFDGNLTDKEVAIRHPGSMDGTNACDAVETRRFLIKRGFLPQNVVPILYKPFDVRWIYWEPETSLLGRKSPDLYRNAFEGNLFIEARQRESMSNWCRGTVGSILCDNFGNGFSNFIPMLLKPNHDRGLFEVESSTRARQLGDHYANLSDAALAYLKDRGGVEAAPDLFFHTVAVLHAPAYAKENAGALRQDWPRVPLPEAKKLLKESAVLGRQVAALLDPVTPVPGVTTGTIRPELKVLGVPTRVGGGQLDPARGDLDVTARWGVPGKGGVCMPSMGKTQTRAPSAEERSALDPHAALLLPLDFTLDVYLNDAACWRCVPKPVWEYTLGGYQVIKKWLSYREKNLLGRALKIEEVSYVQEMIRRIAALILLRPELDRNYEKVKGASYGRPGGKSGETP